MYWNYIEVVRDIVRKFIVLLKNEKGVLLIREEICIIVVIGLLVKDCDFLLGSWWGRVRINFGVLLVEGL